MVTRTRTVIAAAVVAASALGAAVLAGPTGSAGANERWARATLRGADGGRVGTVTFGDGRSDDTEITVRLRRAGGVGAFHGLHVHANDSTANGDGCVADSAQPSATWFVSADGHWKHDAAELHGQHAGDLPSVFVNGDGTAETELVVDKLTPSEVVGRAVVLHAGPDNFGNVPVGPAVDQYTPGTDALAKTQTTGNAGDRFACGVVTGR
jgi:Cu-Zn family superoxide dismutase